MPTSSKTDEFSEKFQGRGGHFQSKNLCCKIWTFKQGYLTMKLIQRGLFRLCFSTIVLIKIKTRYILKKAVLNPLPPLVVIQKIIRFGRVTLPLPSRRSCLCFWHFNNQSRCMKLLWNNINFLTPVDFNYFGCCDQSHVGLWNVANFLV